MVQYWIDLWCGTFMAIADELGWRDTYDWWPTTVAIRTPADVTRAWLRGWK